MGAWQQLSVGGWGGASLIWLGSGSARKHEKNGARTACLIFTHSKAFNSNCRVAVQIGQVAGVHLGLCATVSYNTAIRYCSLTCFCACLSACSALRSSLWYLQHGGHLVRESG